MEQLGLLVPILLVLGAVRHQHQLDVPGQRVGVERTSDVGVGVDVRVDPIVADAMDAATATTLVLPGWREKITFGEVKMSLVRSGLARLDWVVVLLSDCWENFFLTSREAD